jgi:hypothetical protein
MEEKYYHYKIFDFAIRSDILLPELNYCTSGTPRFSFSLSSIPSSQLQEPIWLHHWLLPSGEKSISFARTGERYFLRFPHLADFIFSPVESRIICHPTPDTPHDTVRHLLLDQVIPRIVNHLGRPVIHASGSVINGLGILFLGQTGWGKSTLCASFHQNGFPLLSDDSLILDEIDKTVVGIPSYAGVRLLQDSLKSLHLDRDEINHTQNVAHYSSKKRIIFTKKNTQQSTVIPLKAIFILNNPEGPPPKYLLSFSRITGYLAAIELTKHSFSFDLTDLNIMGKQLKTLAGLCGSKSLSIFNFHFRRGHELLPNVCKEIVSFVTSLP